MRSAERVALAAGAAVVTAGAAAVTATLTVAQVLAASPTPSAQLGDPRSGGQGPGLVGDPLVAIAVVVVIGLLSLAGTLLYVRATGGPRDPGAMEPPGA